MSLKIVFMGSPEFALPTLQTLHKHYDLIGVVTQPDRPAGRGRELKPPPIKTESLKLNIPLIQPKRVKDHESMDQLNAWNPDLIIVAAYGQILKPAVLDLPPKGCINVHASLLPRWRGASPIQAAIYHGDEETGITIMNMDVGMDTGAILSQRAIPINADDTAGSLSPRLSQLGAELLLETLPDYLSGKISPQTQKEEGVTKAPLLKKMDGKLDFNKAANMLEQQVRAHNPWPGAFIHWKNQPLKIHNASTVSESVAIGQTLIYEGYPAIGASDGILILENIQPAGKKPMAGKTFLNGARDWGSITLQS